MTDRSLYDWFHDSALRYPRNTALEVNDIALSYAELLAAVEEMAALTECALGRRPARVGLLASRSLVTYAGYLAILRLGATVVPLNPRAPVDRNLAITAASGLDLTIVDDSAAEQDAEYAMKAPVALLDLTGGRWRALIGTGLAGDRPSPACPPGSLAYIVFTSGSTGVPKGVPMTHANASAFLTEAIPRLGFTPGSRVSQTFEVSFDGSIMEMFGAWGAGATLCVPQHSDVFTPVRFINDKRLTHWLSVPSIISFARRLRALPAGSMRTLRMCMFAGEPLSTELVASWLTAAPNATIHNGYGPTEVTVLTTTYTLPRDRSAWPETSNRTIPIGKVFDSLEWTIRGEDFRPAREGELCVRGPQRFPGYLDPAQNIGRFVSFSGGESAVYDGRELLTGEHWYRTGDRVRIEHGCLVHAGRLDDQVKIRGYRIELGEIESALRRHPDITEVVVLPIAGVDGGTDLHAFYTGGEVPAGDFARLVSVLPGYMRPRGYHHRDSLPLLTVGKIDRKLLAAQLSG